MSFTESLLSDIDNMHTHTVDRTVPATVDYASSIHASHSDAHTIPPTLSCDVVTGRLDAALRWCDQRRAERVAATGNGDGVPHRDDTDISI